MDGSDTKVMKPGPITVEDIEASPIVISRLAYTMSNLDPIGKVHLKLDAITYWVHSWYSQVNEEIVKRALFHQAVQKAPGIDQQKFRALQLLWEWEAPDLLL